MNLQASKATRELRRSWVAPPVGFDPRVVTGAGSGVRLLAEPSWLLSMPEPTPKRSARTMSPFDQASWCPKCKGPMLPDGEGCAHECEKKGIEWQNEHASNPFGIGTTKRLAERANETV